MANSINTVIVFAAMLLTGFLLARFDILDEKTSSKVTKLVIMICVPATMVNNVFTYFDPEMLKSAGLALIVPFLVTFSAWLIAYPVARLFKIPKGKRGVFAVLFAFSNTVFVGLPVNQALFGDTATVPALFYFLGNTAMFWTFGVWGMRNDTGTEGSFFSWKSLKKILSPSLVTLVICLVLLFLGFTPPTFIMNTASQLGKPGTPLAMMIAGGIIYRGVKRGTWKRWEVAPAMLGKLVIAPCLALLFSWIFGVSGFLQQIFICQAAMPVMSQASIVAHNYGADDELASAATVVSMVSLLVVMPVLSMLFA